MESSKEFCTSCNCYRPASDFLLNKKGNRLKTCSKHSKKRARSLDQWDSFLYEIRTWSQPGQTKLLDLKYKFDLDQLPINIGHLAETSDGGDFNFHHLDQAINSLVDFIREAGGNRFRKMRTSRIDQSKYYYYCCSQDSSRVQKSQKIGKRERGLMTRFPCDSGLVIKPDLNSRELSIRFRHKYHLSHDNIQPSQAIMQSITSRCPDQGLAEICRNF